VLRAGRQDGRGSTWRGRETSTLLEGTTARRERYEGQEMGNWDRGGRRLRGGANFLELPTVRQGASFHGALEERFLGVWWLGMDSGGGTGEKIDVVGTEVLRGGGNR